MQMHIILQFIQKSQSDDIMVAQGVNPGLKAPGLLILAAFLNHARREKQKCRQNLNAK